MQSYVKYLSSGFEILGLAALGFFLGRQLDCYFGFQKPWMTLVLALLFSLGALVMVLRRFLAENNRPGPSDTGKRNKP